MGDKQFGKGWLSVNYANNFRLWYSGYGTFRKRDDRRQTQNLPGKTSFPEKIAGSKKRDHGFLALLRDNGDLGFSRLYIENGRGRIALPIDDLIFPIFDNGSLPIHLREEDSGIERGLRLRRRDCGLAHSNDLFNECGRHFTASLQRRQFSLRFSIAARNLLGRRSKETKFARIN